MKITYAGVEADIIQAEPTVWKLAYLFPKTEIEMLSLEGRSVYGVPVGRAGDDDYEKLCIEAQGKLESFFGSRAMLFEA